MLWIATDFWESVKCGVTQQEIRELLAGRHPYDISREQIKRRILINVLAAAPCAGCA